VTNAVDPNDKFGASGFGTHGYIRGDTTVPYRINFENLGPASRDGNGNPFATVATAPAQRVTITDQLEGDLDWSTFRLAELGFGDTIVSIPADSTYFTGSVPITYNGRMFNVELEAGINFATGRIFAIFQSIDPLTSLPPDVLIGFLPPEDSTGRGKGHFQFTIRPKANLPTGTEIRNVALISFDGQTIIATNQLNPLDPAAGTDVGKEALNTIDAGLPSSAVAALTTTIRTPQFRVAWSGQDDDGGSGVGSFDVYVSDNGGPRTLWLDNTTLAEAVFNGTMGHTYAFYSVAIDNVGNVEAAPATPDTTTTLQPGVAGRFLFYNRSSLDGNNAAADQQDAAAIATDKQALLPGQNSTFANISSYSRGINGLILDMTGIAGGLTTSDFVFRMGNTSEPSGWVTAPAPVVTVSPNAGLGASDRVTLVWADGAIKNTWLQVTLLANARTGLAVPDVFFFGSLVGETGDTTTRTEVSARDLVNVRRNLFSGGALAINRYDFNRDGRINASDYIISRNNILRSLSSFSPVAAPATAVQGTVGSRPIFRPAPLQGARRSVFNELEAIAAN
jgi:hypothetical protein